MPPQWKSSWKPGEIAGPHRFRVHMRLTSRPPGGPPVVAQYPTEVVRVPGLMLNVWYLVTWSYSPGSGAIGIRRQPEGWGRRAILARLLEVWRRATGWDRRRPPSSY